MLINRAMRIYGQMSSPSVLSEKSKKYDRQLRLWGDHGQAALEAAQVCLINANATGCEVLKNLILPGIASFTIVDGNKIIGEDVGNNFFLERDCIGKPRAQAVTRYLLELNPDVRGDFVDESAEYLLENNPTYFHNFTVVIASNVCERTLLDLADKLWSANIPLIVCRSYGLIGYIRVQVKEHAVIESKPDSAHEDLRLDHPFQSLKEHINAIDLHKMDRKELRHTPYLIILYKYLEEWKKEHNGGIPRTSKEKQTFKEILRERMKSVKVDEPTPGLEEEENFEEAIKAVNTAFLPTTIPSTVDRIFNHPSCNNLSADSNSFWILSRAVKEFVLNEGNGCLPLRGTIPDMTSDTNKFISLQNVYFNQASLEAEIVYKWVQHFLSKLGKPHDFISEHEVKLFCKNAYFLRVLEGRSLADEYNSKSEKIQEIMIHLDNPDSEIVFYVLLRAVERFFIQYGRYPGHYNDQVETDIVKLKVKLAFKALIHLNLVHFIA
ncbi:NEDD8-activating enzyme E1 regulatory subunit [Chamberlinius hualienensis]